LHKKLLSGYFWRRGYLPKRSSPEIVRMVDRKIKEKRGKAYIFLLEYAGGV